MSDPIRILMADFRNPPPHPEQPEYAVAGWFLEADDQPGEPLIEIELNMPEHQACSAVLRTVDTRERHWLVQPPHLESHDGRTVLALWPSADA